MSPMPQDVRLRAACEADIPFLWRMLTFAASMDATPSDVERARVDPELKDYVEGFGRRGDVGVVAHLTHRKDTLIGAAWVRLAPPGSAAVSPTKVWSDVVPELAIATVREMRGSGVGTRLLHALLEAVSGLHRSVALSVREGSDAIRLYERLGFSVQRRIVNRIGTASLVMVRDLEAMTGCHSRR
jgi:ribosomal protein S18 acetylase RimI-like enzyme